MTELPKITFKTYFGYKTYSVDARLKELRNVANVHDTVPFGQLTQTQRKNVRWLLKARGQSFPEPEPQKRRGKHSVVGEMRRRYSDTSHHYNRNKEV